MGLLNKFFSREKADAVVEADEKSKKIWQDYKSTIEGKHRRIAALSGSNYRSQLELLWKDLTHELVDIEEETKSEEKLMTELTGLKRERALREIHRLEECLRYPESRHQYFDALLSRLHDCVRSQMHIVEKLSFNSRGMPLLLDSLKAQAAIESELIKKMNACSTFEDGVAELMAGVHEVRWMGAQEKKLVEQLQGQVRKVFAGQLESGVVFEWASAVLAGIEDAMFEAIGDQMLGHHESSHFEFVNKPVFEEYVRRCIPKGKEEYEGQVPAFVVLFREWYNQRHLD